MCEEHDFGRGIAAQIGNECFERAALLAAINEVDNEVGIGRIDIVRGGADQGIGAEAADRAVFDREVCLGKTPAQVVLHCLCPPAVDDRLPVENDLDGEAPKRAARGQKRHRALDSASEQILVLGRRRRRQGKRRLIRLRDFFRVFPENNPAAQCCQHKNSRGKHDRAFVVHGLHPRNADRPGYQKKRSSLHRITHFRGAASPCYTEGMLSSRGFRMYSLRPLGAAGPMARLLILDSQPFS